MKKIFGTALLMASLLAGAGIAPAKAQSYVKSSQVWAQQGKIAGGVSVSTSSAATALPATGLTAWICNIGSSDAYLKFGSDNTVVATVSGSSWLKAGTCAPYDLQPLLIVSKYLAAVTASSTTSLTVETGIGTPPSQGAGGGGGGGGGAVTVANGADTAEGNTTDNPATVPTTGSPATSIALLKALTNAVAGPIPPGTNVIGKVAIDQTTPGTTNAVQVLNSSFGISGNLPAFSTTPTFNLGTLNGAATAANQTTTVTALTGSSATTAHGCSIAGYGVLSCLGQIDDDIKGPIAAGTAVIGKVGIDQTTPGTTNGVQVNAPLPAGTNTIGSVKQTDGTTTVLTDPCQGVTPTFTPINVSASGSTRIITGTAAKKTYICSIHLVTGNANNVALTEGTGTNCGTGAAGIIGGTTAASGWNFSANGGISLGNGGFAMLATATNADDVCLNPSASTQLSGMVKWVQQ